MQIVSSHRKQPGEHFSLRRRKSSRRHCRFGDSLSTTAGLSQPLVVPGHTGQTWCCGRKHSVGMQLAKNDIRLSQKPLGIADTLTVATSNVLDGSRLGILLWLCLAPMTEIIFPLKMYLTFEAFLFADHHAYDGGKIAHCNHFLVQHVQKHCFGGVQRK